MAKASMLTGFGVGQQATRLDALPGRYDPWLLGTTLALACLGVVMVASSSIAIGETNHVGPYYYLVKHLVFLAMGMGVAGWLMRAELKGIEQRDHLLLVLCFVLLVAVFLPGVGRTLNGARRWLNFGLTTFQAVEAVKPMFIVWLASYLVRFRDEVNATWAAMLKPLGVAVALVALLLLQPDFGSSSLILAITAGMLVLGGVHLPRMFGPVLVGLPALAAIAIAEPYRLKRLIAFLNPWADPLGDGYQLVNSLMAVGRGELFGVGLGASVQKLYYLPEAHTDFILAIIGEELGALGIIMLLFLYGLVAFAGLRIARNASTPYAQLLAAGVISLYIGQAMLNVFTVLGLAPLTGVPLPFISYGGTTLVTMLIGVGLVLNVAQGGEVRQRAAEPPRDARGSRADAAAEDRHRDRWDSGARRARVDDRRRAAS